ncbi:22559_t:CDS:2 [Entrophospora sp. SA101]|nr:22559_t:CDS:2 [Entrophospora sp. SA101]
MFHPEVEQNILKEIEQVVGDKSNLDYEDLKKMEYIEAVIKEVLRIRPIGTSIGREATNFDQIGDYKIPGSTLTVINVKSLHMNPNYWNEPTKFNPSRFLKNKNHDNNSEDSFIKNTFLPFGGGLRICPGRHLAMNQLKLLVALFYKKYEFELVNDKLIYRNSIINGNQCGELKVKLSHRN